MKQIQITLKQHIGWIHEGFRYLCNRCDYEANTDNTFKQHIGSIHEEVRFPCNRCDYEANKDNTLKQPHLNLIFLLGHECLILIWQHDIMTFWHHDMTAWQTITFENTHENKFVHHVPMINIKHLIHNIYIWHHDLLATL